MSGTADLPILGPGEAAPAFVCPSRLRPEVPRVAPKSLSGVRCFEPGIIAGSGVINFAMPGSVVLFPGSGAVGDPLMYAGITVGHILSSADEDGFAKVLLKQPIESSAETQLVDRVRLGQEYQLRNGDQFSIRPRFQFQ